MGNTYPKLNDDAYGWAIYTANLLREQKMNEVNFDEVLEEIESLGRSERHELNNRLAVLIMHLLKWQYQPGLISKSWKLTIQEQRAQVESCLFISPSLKSKINDILPRAYKLAVIKAENETGLDENKFPAECPYSFEQITDNDFYPSN